jgi:hypothetical protein
LIFTSQYAKSLEPKDKVYEVCGGGPPSLVWKTQIREENELRRALPKLERSRATVITLDLEF